MKKKILVTGGLGYIGSHCVISLLENDYEPIIIDNLSNSKIEALNRIELISHHRPKTYIEDVRDENKLEKIHLTTRQAIQLHGLTVDQICNIMEASAEKKQLYIREQIGIFANTQKAEVNKMDMFTPFFATF